MNNSKTLHRAYENGLSVEANGRRDINVSIPSSAFEESWKFLDDIGMRDYYVRKSVGFSVHTEDEFRVMLALLWQLNKSDLMDHSGYEHCLEMAYYEGPWDDDESPLAKLIADVANKRAKQAA